MKTKKIYTKPKLKVKRIYSSFLKKGLKPGEEDLLFNPLAKITY